MTLTSEHWPVERNGLSAHISKFEMWGKDLSIDSLHLLSGRTDLGTLTDQAIRIIYTSLCIKVQVLSLWGESFSSYRLHKLNKLSSQSDTMGLVSKRYQLLIEANHSRVIGCTSCCGRPKYVAYPSDLRQLTYGAIRIVFSLMYICVPKVKIYKVMSSWFIGCTSFCWRPDIPIDQTDTCKVIS